MFQKAKIGERLRKEQESLCEICLQGGEAGTDGTLLSDLSDSLDTGSLLCMKGGRSLGSTNNNKRKKKESIIQMNNDISMEYCRLRSETKRLKNGQLKKIIEKHKSKRHLYDVDIPEKTIRMRSFRKNPVLVHDHHGGLQSPLVEIDDVVVKIVLMMA